MDVQALPGFGLDRVLNYFVLFFSLPHLSVSLISFSLTSETIALFAESHRGPMNFDVLRIHQSVPYVKCLAALFDACLELAVFVCLPQSSANALHPAPINRDAGWLAGGMLCESQIVKRGFIRSGIANDL